MNLPECLKISQESVSYYKFPGLFFKKNGSLRTLNLEEQKVITTVAQLGMMVLMRVVTVKVVMFNAKFL